MSLARPISETPYRVGIVGAGGYTGIELCRLLLAHPYIRIDALFAKTQAGQVFSDLYPQFLGLLDLVLEPVDLPRIEAAKQPADRQRQLSHLRLIVIGDLPNRTCPRRSIGDGQHPAVAVAVVGIIRMKHFLIDDHRRSGAASHHHFIVVRQVATIGITVRVQRQVRPGNDFEWASLGSQVVQVIQHSDQTRRAGCQTEYLRAIRLRVCVDRNSRMTWS